MNIQRKVRSESGFTLIELLVVIAIIGLLAAVVLASLNSARQKGADAAIKADLRNAQSQAAIVYDNANPNLYTGVCADPAIRAQVTHASNATGATVPTWANTDISSATQSVCHSTAANYAILVPLKSNSANGWCVDDTGVARSVVSTALGNGVVACP